MLSNILKALLVENGIQQQDLTKVLKFSSKQAVNNKFAKNNWTVKDVVRILNFLNDKLIIDLGDRQIQIAEKDLK